MNFSPIGQEVLVLVHQNKLENEIFRDSLTNQIQNFFTTRHPEIQWTFDRVYYPDKSGRGEAILTWLENNKLETMRWDFKKE